jgi:hypothetical protein
MFGVSTALCADPPTQSLGSTAMSKGEARRSRGWFVIGAPRTQVALVIETAGTVLLSCEIRMCLTPSLVYELRCASHPTPVLRRPIPLL